MADLNGVRHVLFEKNRTQRNPEPERFRGRHKIRQHCFIRRRRELVKRVPTSGPSKSALDFIADQQCIVLCGELPRRSIKLLGHQANPAFALDRFEYNGANLVVEFALEVGNVIESDEVESGDQRFKRIAVFLLTCRR
jgi:hypothetical protein